MVTSPETPQQYIEPLGFGDENRGTQSVAKVEAFRIGIIIQQLLGQQDADHVVLVLAYDRKARVPGLEHERNEAGRLVLDRYHVHLRARDHDVAHGHFGNLQGTFDDRQRIGVEELTLEGTVQQLEELFAVLRLTRQKSRQPFEERRFFREPGVTVVFGGAHRLGAARVSASPRAAYGSATPSAARIATSRASIRAASSARPWS